ncbi:hypothetical protein CHU98_g73 [Xylaria longipes]|nr:hypothetical protein CHU98_g73 [Xylaria longipes]
MASYLFQQAALRRDINGRRGDGRDGRHCASMDGQNGPWWVGGWKMGDPPQERKGRFLGKGVKKGASGDRRNS